MEREHFDGKPAKACVLHVRAEAQEICTVSALHATMIENKEEKALLNQHQVYDETGRSKKQHTRKTYSNTAYEAPHV